MDGQEIHRLNEQLPKPVLTRLFFSTWLRAPNEFAGEYDPEVVQPRTSSAFDWVAFRP